MPLLDVSDVLLDPDFMDPRSVGTEVERRQQSANAQVMRGNQTKVG
ncbi:hypothetical protein [Enterobacter asburiae]